MRTPNGSLLVYWCDGFTGKMTQLGLKAQPVSPSLPRLQTQSSQVFF